MYNKSVGLLNGIRNSLYIVGALISLFLILCSCGFPPILEIPPIILEAPPATWLPHGFSHDIHIEDRNVHEIYTPDSNDNDSYSSGPSDA
jgi:hypothetical protein